MIARTIRTAVPTGGNTDANTMTLTFLKTGGLRSVKSTNTLSQGIVRPGTEYICTSQYSLSPANMSSVRLLNFTLNLTVFNPM